MTKLYVLLLVVASLFLVAGCASSPIDREYSKWKDKIDDDYQAHFIKEAGTPIADDMSSDGFIDGFLSNTCRLNRDKKKNTEEAVRACHALYFKTANERFKARYTLSDNKTVDAKCALNREACSDLQVSERWLRESHNEVLGAMRLYRLEQLEKWKAQAEAQHSGASLANAGAALTGLSSQLANMNRPQPPSHDRARDCRTVPDGLGGLLTECH